MEHLEELKTIYPDIEQRLELSRRQVADYLRHTHPGKRGQRDKIVIPVVVHVMHNGEPVGTGKNISDTQIYSQLRVLNEDYQALNSDLADVPNHFTNVIGNPELEFCLAAVDPQGNPTDGIERINLGANGTWNLNMKPNTIWDATQYLNIWIAELSGGTLGFTTFPGTPLSYDGVVIDYRYFGAAPANPFPGTFNLGRTATHEIGHWLGLEHTFSGGCAGTSPADCSTAGDRICDTPPTRAENFGCSLSTTQNTCTETPIDLPDMWMNFLDYMDDACLYMFTQEQVDAMRAVLNTTRASILNSTACPQILFTISGKVVDAQNGEGVSNAKVLFLGSTDYELECDANGNFSSPIFREGTYVIYSGKWGYVTKEFSAGMQIHAGSAPLTISLTKGYYDDFLIDYGWIPSGSAITGLWERGIPQGTDYNGAPANPGNDISGDLGDICYMTGNGGGAVGNDDVDEGNVALKSPLFNLAGYQEPYLSYYRWFFNGGGQGNPNDRLTISISNGTQTKIIETLDAYSANSNQWNLVKIKVRDFIEPGDSMQLMVETADDESMGHIVEAALDGFRVKDSVDNQIPFSFTGRVVDSQSGRGIANAKVLFLGGLSIEVETDASGYFYSPNFRQGSYSVYAGKWGYMTSEFSGATLIDPATAPFIIPVDSGCYYDDFIMDFGWTTSGSAASGNWERGLPAETRYAGQTANPGYDAHGDFGSYCYVTGNAGGDAENDDVDKGNVILSSPLFDLSRMQDPFLSYSRWLFSHGDGEYNDKMIVRISNGQETSEIETIVGSELYANRWTTREIRIKDFITPTATMQFSAEVSGESVSSRILEAALDKFRIVDSLDYHESKPVVAAYPNPASSALNVRIDSGDEDITELSIFDISGKRISRANFYRGTTSFTISLEDYSSGVYFFRLGSEKDSPVMKIAVIH